MGGFASKLQEKQHLQKPIVLHPIVRLPEVPSDTKIIRKIIPWEVFFS